MISSKPLRPPRSPRDRHRSVSRSLFTAGTVALVLISGTSGALAQPTTTPAPTPSGVGPEASAPPVDPCATPPTAAPTTTTTAPPATTTTAVPTPPCDTVPAAPDTSTAAVPSVNTSPPMQAPAPAPAPAPERATAPSLAQAPLPAEPASDEPVAPTDENLSSKTAEPDPDWAPTENPNAAVVPGEMRSDREEIPAPFTKEDADKAETMEARQRVSRAAAGCQIYWPSPYEVCGVIRDRYNSLGGPGSFLSFPTSGELTNPGNSGKRSQFLNGPIYWSASTGAHPVVNSFLFRWQQLGYESANGMLGYPTTDEIVHSNGQGRQQEFQRGVIYVAFQNAVGSALRNGLIRDKYNSFGGHSGPLGYPSSDPIEVTKYGGRYNNFVNGTITWSSQTGARLLFGAVRDRWHQLGREDGALGYPLGDEEALADGGHLARFEDGSSIYWTLLTGAWQVPPAMLGVWAANGYQSGVLGYPIAAPAGDAQRFQFGQIEQASSDISYVGVYKELASDLAQGESVPTGAEQRQEIAGGVAPRQSYPSADVEGFTANPTYGYTYMPVRTGFYNGDANVGFGYDKAYHKHNLTGLGSILFALASPFAMPRNDGGAGLVFYATAQKVGKSLVGGNRQVIDEQIIYAIHDPEDWPTYYGLPAGNPLGLVTAYCDTDDADLECPQWVENVSHLGPN